MSSIGAHAQWRATGAGAVVISPAVVVSDEDGSLLYSTDTGAEAEGYVTELGEDGWLVIDPDAEEGLRIRVLPTQIIVY